MGQVQWQFNRTRGFSDANQRDSVFDDKKGRDDAMVFGEHLGQPPGYNGYWDAGMRLVDNDLRSKLNSQLGNPWGTLAGLDSPGAGGFSASLGVTHANSHDSDYAAQKEFQHAHYMFREGIGLIYSDGYYKAATLGESGGAFPRHANTQFLGQFSDPRIPNILKLHNDFARGLQQGRWGDSDYMAYERRDNRDKFGNTRIGTASEEITMVRCSTTTPLKDRPAPSARASGLVLISGNMPRDRTARSWAASINMPANSAASLSRPVAIMFSAGARPNCRPSGRTPRSRFTKVAKRSIASLSPAKTVRTVTKVSTPTVCPTADIRWEQRRLTTPTARLYPW